MSSSKPVGQETETLNVMLLTHSFWPESSPPQRRWKSFTRAIAASGHRVSVVTPRAGTPRKPASQGRTATDAGVQIIRYPGFGLAAGLAGKTIRSLGQAVASIPASLRQGRQDIVIATVPALSMLFSGFAVSRLLRAQFVVDLRDPWPDLFRDSNILRARILEPVAIRAMLCLLRRADLVITVTEGLARNARSQGMLNVATVPNGVDLAKCPVPLKREQAPAAPGRLQVLYLGNVGLSQGLDLLVRAAAQLSGSIHVRIVGDGNDRNRLRQLAVDLEASVEFLDPVRGEQTLEMYRWADTVVVSLRPDWPSFNHTVPSKLYELLALDLHVTGLVRGEAAAIIDNAKAGQLVGQDLESLTSHLRQLHCNRDSLRVAGNGPQWIAEHANLAELGSAYARHLEALGKPATSKRRGRW